MPELMIVLAERVWRCGARSIIGASIGFAPEL